MQNNEYFDIVIEESKEHLQSLNDQLLLLENDPTNLDTISEIFRSAHTLKGMAATMGFNDLADLTHKMENVLDGIRNHEITIHTDIIDVLFASVDHLEEMVIDIANGGNGSKDVSEVIDKLKLIEQGDSEDIADENVNQEISPKTNEESKFSSLNEFEITLLDQAHEKNFHTYEV